MNIDTLTRLTADLTRVSLRNNCL